MPEDKARSDNSTENSSKKCKYCVILVCFLGLLACGAGVLIWHFRHLLNLGAANQTNRSFTQTTPRPGKTFPDVDYVLLGYNLLKGYPFSSKRDPGFTNPIFSASYENGTLTSDLRYRVPTGFHMIPDTSCQLDFTSRVVETSFELSEALSVSISASIGAKGLSFGVSPAFQFGMRELTEKGLAYIFSTAMCHQYNSKINKINPPPFSSEFVEWVHKLDNADIRDKPLYLKFFAYYGTHFMVDVTFGSKLIFQFTSTSKTLSQFWTQGQSINLNVGVTTGKLGGSLGLGFGTSVSESSSKFLKNSKKLTITIGAKPPADGNVNRWAASSKNQPVPIAFKLDSIEKLFTKYYMSEIGVNYTRIHNAMLSHKESYCLHLRDMGEIHSCVDLATEGILLHQTGLTRLSIDDEPRDNPDSNITAPFDATREKCFMSCFDSRNCVAVEFCRNCRPDDDHYRKCYMYRREESLNVRGFQRETFETLVRPVSFEKYWGLDNTEIIGGGSKLYASNKTECCQRCQENDMCTAVTFCHCENGVACECDDLAVNCFIYTKKAIKQLAERPNRLTIFIMR